MIYREAISDDTTWIRKILVESWASTRVVSRGVIHEADKLPAILAVERSEKVGLLTYNISNTGLEVVTLNSLRERKGIGTELVLRAEEIARKHNCPKIWVVTTNDNSAALKFYQALGFDIAAVHKNAIEVSRRLKPEIPLVGNHGIPITDEIELEKLL